MGAVLNVFQFFLIVKGKEGGEALTEERRG